MNQITQCCIIADSVVLSNAESFPNESSRIIADSGLLSIPESLPYDAMQFDQIEQI